MLYEMFDIHGAIAKCHLALLLGGLEAFLKLFRCLRHTHTFTAAAKSRLDNHRIADLFRGFLSSLHIINGFFTARDYRHPRRHHGISGFLLISKTCDHFRIRTDKRNIALLTELCKFTVLRQKTKTRMDRVRAADDRGAQNAVHT